MASRQSRNGQRTGGRLQQRVVAALERRDDFVHERQLHAVGLVGEVHIAPPDRIVGWHAGQGARRVRRRLCPPLCRSAAWAAGEGCCDAVVILTRSLGASRVWEAACQGRLGAGETGDRSELRKPGAGATRLPIDSVQACTMLQVQGRVGTRPSAAPQCFQASCPLLRSDAAWGVPFCLDLQPMGIESSTVFPACFSQPPDAPTLR